jgi:GH43 family beta-xylosidase
MTLLRWVLPAASLVAVACSSSTATAPGGPPPQPPPQGACTFSNPIAFGADPWVVQHDGWYYMIQSRDNGIWVSRSRKLTQVDLAPQRVWTAPDTGWNRTNIWAPELHRIDGRWYVYYAAGRAGPPFIHQRSGVLESVADDPLGPYVDKGMLYTGDSIATRAGNRWAIDVTVRRVGGHLYAVWSGWESEAATDRTPQHLYAARMSNPWTITTNRVRISSPTASWERGTELDLQEGPEFLERDGQLFIVYSTRESWLQHYKLGLLRVQGPTPDPTNAASIAKTGPVFSPANQVYGVGHGSFTKSPDGSEDWHVYHAKVDTLPGWNRVIRMQKFEWNADGTPNFGTPTPSGTPTRVPSGECTP